MIRRVRSALLILVISGSILNLWTALDAISQVPPLPSVSREGSIEARPPNGVDWTKYGGTATTQDPHFAALDQLIAERRHQAERDYYWPREFPIWERAAKIEFAALAVSLCVWLLLPRDEWRKS